MNTSPSPSIKGRQYSSSQFMDRKKGPNLSHFQPSSQAFPVGKACRIIREEKGRQFDPQLVDVFLANVDEARSIAGKD